MESLLRQSAFMGGCEAGRQALKDQSLDGRVLDVWDARQQKWFASVCAASSLHVVLVCTRPGCHF
jgi:hypothetical protein